MSQEARSRQGLGIQGSFHPFSQIPLESRDYKLGFKSLERVGFLEV